jgi:hypothetical protein
MKTIPSGSKWISSHTIVNLSHIEFINNLRLNALPGKAGNLLPSCSLKKLYPNLNKEYYRFREQISDNELYQNQSE